MKKYHLIDLPVFTDPSKYDQAILKATELLSSLPEITSVYQIGGVSAPGISDIDLVVVFKNGTSSGYSLHEHLSASERYLFVHRAYGISEEQFLRPLSSQYFHNFKLLSGRDLLKKTEAILQDQDLIRKQIAYEFLLKMWMVMSVQEHYRLIKVRAFLLEAHALKYDLEFLDIHSGDLYDVVQEIIHLRKSWFDSDASESKLLEVFQKLQGIICETLDAGARSDSFYLPPKFRYRTANMVLKQGKHCKVKRRGIIIPPVVKGKKYFNLLHRFNHFTFTLPFNDAVIPDAIQKRFSFVEELRKYNLIHLPDFLPLVSSLKFD
jgi:hypothetical protein